MSVSATVPIVPTPPGLIVPVPESATFWNWPPASALVSKPPLTMTEPLFAAPVVRLEISVPPVTFVAPFKPPAAETVVTFVPLMFAPPE